MTRPYRLSAHHQKQVADRAAKALDMAERYEAGATLQQIGDIYGITRERVRQLIKQEFGFTGKDGGATARRKRNAEAAAHRRELQYVAKHGMTLSEFRRINSAPRYYDRPIAKYRSQISNSRRRNIPWRMTFAEWWGIWEKSGKWSERGPGSGYVMSRHGDRGAYEAGNVRIIPAPLNNSEYIRRFWAEIRSGKRPAPKFRGGKAKSSVLSDLIIGQTVTFPLTQKRPVYAQNWAHNYARSRGWKVSASTRTGQLVVTRIQ